MPAQAPPPIAPIIFPPFLRRCSVEPRQSALSQNGGVLPSCPAIDSLPTLRCPPQVDKLPQLLGYCTLDNHRRVCDYLLGFADYVEPPTNRDIQKVPRGITLREVGGGGRTLTLRGRGTPRRVHPGTTGRTSELLGPFSCSGISPHRGGKCRNFFLYIKGRLCVLFSYNFDVFVCVFNF